MFTKVSKQATTVTTPPSLALSCVRTQWRHVQRPLRPLLRGLNARGRLLRLLLLRRLQLLLLKLLPLKL